MKPLLTLLTLLLHLTLNAQPSGLSLTLAQGLTQSNSNVHLASDISLDYSAPIKNGWSATFSGLLARSVLETDLRLPGEMCNALFSDCDEAPVSYLSKEIRGGLSIGFQRTWDRLSFGFFVRGMTRLNNRLDVLPAEENRFFVGLGTNPTFTQYGDTFAPLADEVADVGQFIAISDQFRLQPGLMVNWKLNETISVGLITRLDLLTPNEVELLSIGGFRANPEIPSTIFAGRSRGYYFQGSFRVAI